MLAEQIILLIETCSKGTRANSSLIAESSLFLLASGKLKKVVVGNYLAPVYDTLSHVISSL